MMRFGIGSLAAMALIGSAAANAQQPPPTQAQEQAQAQIDIVAKRLCKAEPVVGTRLARKRCNTPAELVEYQRQAREFIENYRRSPCMAGAESGDNRALSC